MKITANLYEAYLKCPTKCWLISQGETGLGNTYAVWFRAQDESYRSEEVRRLLDDFPQNECAIAPPELVNLKSDKWRLAVDILMQAHSMETRLHAVERVQHVDGGKPGQFIPIYFVFTSKITQDDKLRVAFDALILSEALGCKVSFGKIIHGESHITTKINTAILADKVMKQIKDVAALISEHSPPDLVLIRYCAECEFQLKCRQIAFEKDDLSLLSSMTRNERKQYRSKGIFTVNQLSYTFRPRRTPKKTKNPTKKHYPALQALAIRENTVFFNGIPSIPESATQIYLDIEGLPDHNSYYLIGALIISDGQDKFYSFWADDDTEELAIFNKFINIIDHLTDFKIFHYGDYEETALKKVKLRIPEDLQQKIDYILTNSINVLSLVHSHIYFPTYSNSLKDIGKLLDYEWSTTCLTGLNTIILRSEWSQSKSQEAKNSLITYNQDDCKALRLLCNFIDSSGDYDKSSNAVTIKTNLTQQMIKTRPYWQLFDPKPFAIEDLKHISKCGYFDYQREKVFIRTDSHIKALKVKIKKHNFQSEVIHPTKILRLELKKCIYCRSSNIIKSKELSNKIVNLKFNTSGVSKIVTRYISWNYVCKTCKKQFTTAKFRQGNSFKYGHSLACWCVYLNHVCGIGSGLIWKSIRDIFGMHLPEHPLRWVKQYIAELYQSLYKEILQSILSGTVIHIDETTVELCNQQQKSYVWVITSSNKVFYFYRQTRETSFLKEMLAPFNGILVSDFYTGYDSLPCEQQKCLVHLVRDIDDDVLRNPFDDEIKVIAQEFGVVLRSIINTIDRYGLKKWHFQKHKKDVSQFFAKLAQAEYSSEVAIKYKKRFEKSGAKMFTFLDHDGVPWNNNNAEHAIKRIAKHRRNAGGRFTEHSLEEFLVLASVFETCEFNNMNILQFLLSKVNTLDGLLQIARQRSSQPVNKAEHAFVEQ